MKKIYTLVYRSDDKKILTFGGGLPFLETNETDTFGVAYKLLMEYIGADCCMMSRLFNTDEIEIYQALEVDVPPDEFWSSRRVSFAWLDEKAFAETYPEVLFPSWERVIYRKNLAKEVANKIEKEHFESIEQKLSERA